MLGKRDCPPPTHALVAVTRQTDVISHLAFYLLLSVRRGHQPGITLDSAREKGLRMGVGCYPCQT